MLPYIESFSNSKGKPDESICVISIYGKSRYNPFVSKASHLNPIVDKEIFQGPEGLIQNQVKHGNLECYFDTSSRIMYLHLTSHYDLNILSQKCHELSTSENTSDFYSLCQDEDVKHAKTLLLLFTLSHIMILFHPGGTFDLSYLRLFHSLDAVRGKLQTSMCEILSSISGVSSKWSNFGRVCTPRVLFVFETPCLEMHPEDTENSGSKSSKKYPPMKKLQMGIEDMIYRILRKTRAITNISNNSLFSIPGNQQFVFLHSKRQDISDPSEFMTALIRHHCTPQSEAVVPSDAAFGSHQKPKSYSSNRRKVNPPVPESLGLSTSSHSATKTGATTQLASSPSSSSSPGGRQPGLSKSNEPCLKEFLRQHVDMVFSKSVNDNVGRNAVDPIFELPQLGTWLQVANKIYDFFFSETYSNVTAQPFSLFRNSLDISTRFSENRCNKVLPLAESAYQQDLPQYYITSYHESRLNKAKRVFSQYARGPGYDKYMKELEKSCIRFWKSGRQQCEVLSLTGNLCTNKVHLLPGEEPDGPDDIRVVTNHCSMVKTKAACNCGRMQSDKDDPFDFKSANYDFYQGLESICCSKLDHIALPVFTASTPEPKAASVPSILLPQGEQEVEATKERKDSSTKESEKPDVFGTLSELSLALSLGQNALQAEDFEPKMSPGDGNKGSQKEAAEGGSEKQSQASPELKQSETTMKIKPLRQVSTTEYLAYMVHSHSPPGLLPMFSSFSVCRLGPHSLYSHMMGLELPGFLPGSNFLLPWDISVKSEHAWPSVAETFTSGKKRQQRKISKPGPEPGDTAVTVRVYLGLEYECPRGHRFFCSGPDKIIKVSSNSIVKDNASRLVHMDMPLYTSCHCKQPKGCLAQMMRVYVCTPRDNANVPSLRVMVNPLIQPAPSTSSHSAGASSSGCPQFYAGLDTPLELPADSIWVIRLPSIYQDEHQVYLMPTDHQILHSCVLLSGMFSYRML